jgi:hypothetical protein
MTKGRIIDLAGAQEARHGDVDWMLLTASTLTIVPL